MLHIYCRVTILQALVNATYHLNLRSDLRNKSFMLFELKTKNLICCLTFKIDSIHHHRELKPRGPKHSMTLKIKSSKHVIIRVRIKRILCKFPPFQHNLTHFCPFQHTLTYIFLSLFFSTGSCNLIHIQKLLSILMPVF